MAKLIHTMIRVHDLPRSLQFYQNAFNFDVSHRLDFPDFTLVYLRNKEADAEIELTWNKGRAEPYSHGDGYGHVAVCVDDAKSERQRLVDFATTTVSCWRAIFSFRTLTATRSKCWNATAIINSKTKSGGRRA
jgi:lactoylglutathione lyase